VEEVVEEKPEVVEVVKESEPVQEAQPKAKKPAPVKPKTKQPVVKKPVVEEIKKTKKDLIDYMVDNTDLNKSKANKFLKYFAEVISDALKESDSIKLDGFGTFLVLDIEESTRYIPSKDEMRVLPAHKEVRYRAASELKDLLNVDEK
jgi:DNA-binding protein HU-beta